MVIDLYVREFGCEFSEKNRKCAVTQERLTTKERQLTLLPLLINKPKSEKMMKCIVFHGI